MPALSARRVLRCIFTGQLRPLGVLSGAPLIFGFFMERYGIIENKRKREIVLLRGSGCVYKKCTFCDYYLDACKDGEENFALNAAVLEKVTGKYGDLEVINSGSVFELENKTLALIKKLCAEKNIRTLHFEAHYLYRDRIPALREYFAGVTLKMKLGLETFDCGFRERVLKKGIGDSDPAVIAEHFDEANFLFGIEGQAVESMRRDIELGLKYFERICINVMCNNTTAVVPCREVIDNFIHEIYPQYKDDWRVDILIENTGFGVGDR